jgi:hypothetical protein
MTYEFTNQFLKDIKRFGKNKKLIHLLGAKIKETNLADSIDGISGLQIIRGTAIHFRFKIRTETTIYRIGIKKLKKVIWFACIDSNKKRFYKRFP